MISLKNLTIDINKLDDKDGKSRLHRAAADKEKGMLRGLLYQKADVNLRDKYHDRTPLHFAVKTHRYCGNIHTFELAEILLNKGADVNARDKDGQTPLHLVVQKGDVKLIQLFLKFKAEVNILDNLGCSPLFYAVVHNSIEEVAQLLIDLGCNVNHHSNNGSTPLHWVCRKLNDEKSQKLKCHEKNTDKFKMLKCLLKNGADINAVDNKGAIPLFEAKRGLDSTEEGLKKLEKKLNLIIEHTDFNLIGSSDKHISCFTKLPFNLCKLILKHIAKLEVLNIPVNPALLKIISKDDKFNDYYKKCEDELIQAKNTKLQNSSITYYNLLVDGKKKLKEYVSNQDLIEDFEKSDCAKKFPIYGVSMCENVKKEVKRRELFEKSSIELSSCLPVFDQNHLIIHDMLIQVKSKKVLLKFCTSKIENVKN